MKDILNNDGKFYITDKAPEGFKLIYLREKYVLELEFEVQVSIFTRWYFTTKLLQ